MTRAPEIDGYRISQRVILVAILPIAATALAAVIRIFIAKGAGVAGLALCVGALFALTLVAAVYSFRKFPALHLLPFVWNALMILELVVSPSVDVLMGTWPLDSYRFVDSMTSASMAASLFVLGVFAATVAAKRLVPSSSDSRAAPIAAQPAGGLAMLVLLVMFIGVSLLAQIYVLNASGALSGDLAEARGAGLIGTSMFSPFIRLSNYASLVGGWFAVTNISRQRRRVFATLAVLGMVASVFMPLVLRQRFGLLQAVACFAYPGLVARRWRRFSDPRFLLRWLLPILIVLLIVNAVSTVWREAMMQNRDPTLAEFVVPVDPIATKATHFRHLWVLSELIARGAGRSDGLSGTYSHNPVFGDFLVVLPRASFPNKPTSSFEMANGILFGWHYDSTDRGAESLFTPGWWAQFYLTGGMVGIGLLSFAFTLLSLIAWAWARRRYHRPYGALAAAAIWLQCGWLAFNVTANTIELPGMLLAMGLVFAVSALRASTRRMIVSTNHIENSIASRVGDA